MIKTTTTKNRWPQKKKNQVPVQMVTYKDPELIFSHVYTRSTATYETISSEKPKKYVPSNPYTLGE